MQDYDEWSEEIDDRGYNTTEEMQYEEEMQIRLEKLLSKDGVKC